MRFSNTPSITELVSTRLRSRAVNAPCLAQVYSVDSRQTLAVPSELGSGTWLPGELSDTRNTPLHHATLRDVHFLFLFPF